VTLDEIAHELRKALMLAIRPTWLKHYRLTFDVSEFAKTLAACFPEVLSFSGDERKDVADAWNLPRRLRSSEERPCR
jgi:hypothetical protein